MEAFGKQPKSFCDLNRGLGGETEDPFEVPPSFYMSKETVAQDQQVSDPYHTKRDTKREGPRARNLKRADGGSRWLIGGALSTCKQLSTCQNPVRQPEPIRCRPIKKTQPNHESSVWRVDEPTENQAHSKSKCCLQ